MSETKVDSAADVSPGRLWFGVSAAMIAWILQGLSGFVISDAACSGNRVAPWALVSAAELQAILIAISVIALCVALAAGMMSYGIWRRVSNRQLRFDQAPGRVPFMALTGIFMSAIFSIAIVWGGLGPILTGLCEATR